MRNGMTIYMNFLTLNAFPPLLYKFVFLTEFLQSFAIKVHDVINLKSVTILKRNRQI
jgi:hypothetical protein